MKKSAVMIVIVIILALLLIAGFACWGKQPLSAEITGTWMLYEGGYVAPEILTFNADGTGTAYALSDAYQDNSMTEVQIPRSCLEHAEAFRWSVENGTLTFIYVSGDSESYEMSFYTMTDVRMLSLKDGIGGGGYVLAEIVD